ncbi:MAG: hypothetical protein GY803_16480, partial [Chloroflexi bacterium]|nr:hypothetical protein [Chloroflexota bacterium]
ETLVMRESATQFVQFLKEPILVGARRRQKALVETDGLVSPPPRPFHPVIVAN